MKIKTQKKGKVLKSGFLFMFVAFVFLGFYLYFNKSGFTQKGSVPQEINKTLSEISPTPQVFEWQEYKNEEYGFRLEHPKLLFKRTFKDKGGYPFFIRFEETKFSLEKGLALGISKRPQEEEIESVISSLSKEGAKLVREEKIKVQDVDGTRLDFEPEREGEKRSLVIFSKGNYTYSISTVPEQIERVIESFGFIN